MVETHTSKAVNQERVSTTQPERTVVPADSTKHTQNYPHDTPQSIFFSHIIMSQLIDFGLQLQEHAKVIECTTNLPTIDDNNHT